MSKQGCPRSYKETSQVSRTVLQNQIFGLLNVPGIFSDVTSDRGTTVQRRSDSEVASYWEEISSETLCVAFTWQRMAYFRVNQPAWF